MINTHTPVNGPFSETTRVSRYQKGKTNLDFTEDWLFLPTYKYAKNCHLFRLRQYGNPSNSCNYIVLNVFVSCLILVWLLFAFSF